MRHANLSVLVPEGRAASRRAAARDSRGTFVEESATLRAWGADETLLGDRASPRLDAAAIDGGFRRPDGPRPPPDVRIVPA